MERNAIIRDITSAENIDFSGSSGPDFDTTKRVSNGDGDWQRKRPFDKPGGPDFKR